MHKRIWGSISRRPSQKGERPIPNGDSPEASVARGVRLFCESGGPNNSGEEVLHLPVIVEAAESSPAAATEASLRIRKFLSKENYQRAYVQYNAIMLVRILADNPGKSFTRNLDAKFAATVKDLLREGRDGSVQQILRETLDSFETQKPSDETLETLREMWKKEKTRMLRKGDTVAGAGGVRTHISREQTIQQLKRPPPQQPMTRNLTGPSFTSHNNYLPPQNQQNYFARSHHTPRSLPSPPELAQRIEEAKTSAKLLSQVVQSTPPADILSNDLIKEFADRCSSASRSVQGYIHSDNPPPDEDTLLTLIETNDVLSTAMSRHQRALLQARRATPSPHPPMGNQNGLFEAPPPSIPSNGPPPGLGFTAQLGPPPAQRQRQSQSFQPPQAPPLQTSPPTQTKTAPQTHHQNQNPFGDPSPNTEDDSLPPPLSPSYGLPPASVRDTSTKQANDTGGVYRPGYSSTQPQHGGSSSHRPNGTTRNNEDSDDDEEARRPVQYRF